MRRNLGVGLAVVLAVVALAAWGVPAWTHCGSCGVGDKTHADDHAHPHAAPAAAVALEGNCPVCIIDGHKWMQGSPDHQVVHDGQTYYFPGEKQKEEFLANPARYVPALGGDCAVCFAKMGKRMPGNIRHAAFFEDRLYLFPGDKQKEAFTADPRSFADADLALEGNCPVCQVEMNASKPGKEDIHVIHDGLRYLFPGQKQREMFLADPDKYKVTQLQ